MIKKIGNKIHKPVLIKSNDIEVRATKYTGYGVFAINEISKDTIIEECVVAGDRLPYTNHAFINYKFAGEDSDVMILGNACILNHSKTPNCKIVQNMDYERVVKIIAIKTIIINEELTHTYSKDYENQIKR